MTKTYEMKEYVVVIMYHTQRVNLVKRYRVSGNNKEVAELLALGKLLQEEARYIKVDIVDVKEINEEVK